MQPDAGKTINGHRPTASSSRGVTWPEVTTAGKPRAKSQANIDTFLGLAGVTLARNEFSHRCEVTIAGEVQTLNDDVLRQLWLEADSLGLSPPIDFFEHVLLDRARANSHHPVRDYLDGLEWDGQERLGEWLHAYAGAAPTQLNEAFGRAMLIAAVRRVRRPGVKFDTAVVFEGKQGAGKSRLLRALAGPEYFTDALTVGEDAKSVIEKTSGAWIVEMAELEGIGKKEVQSVKAMLSRQSDRARLPYARTATDVPRQFILCGTVNDSHYLRDASGNRRFWPVRVGAIDVESLERDRDQLWAEAAYWEAKGEPIELPRDLWGEAAREQEERTAVDPWFEDIAAWFDDKVGWIPTARIYQHLELKPQHQDPRAGARLSAILTRLGFRRVQKGKVWGYTNLPKGEALRELVV